MTRAKNPAGPWEPLRLIRKVTGWIDPCPFWDDDGNAYLIHAFANSRCGIKSILAINRMSPEGTEIFDDGIIVFNGQKDHPTIEGPKLYKRNGYYYIFAPAGGVKTGWQTVLRAKNIFGPYEDRIALEQGNTKINGPHQGAWITTPTGTDWFVHFQDRYAYGRIVHLQPVQWINDWPVMGIDLNGNGIGEPVGEYSTPLTGTARPDPFTQTSDDFDSSSLGLQWQWQSNSKTEWYSLTAKNGLLRLYSQPSNANDENLWNTGALLMQKFPRDKFSLTVKLALKAHSANNKAGLLIFGMDYSYIALEKTPTGFQVTHRLCNNANSGKPEQTIAKTAVPVDSVFLRVSVEESNPGDIIPKVNCSFAYSLDGKNFMRLGGLFTAREGKWVGAKVGLFCTTTAQADTNDNADIDWIRFED
jgi:beta-xylosidase